MPKSKAVYTPEEAARRVVQLEKKRQYQATYRAKNPEKVRASKAAYAKANRAKVDAAINDWRKRNPERRAATTRKATAKWRDNHPDKAGQWAKANKDRVRELQAQWMIDNPGRMRELQREWRVKNPDKVRAHGQTRRARKNNAPGKFTNKDILECLTLQGWRCFYCLVSLAVGYHIDHMTPLSRGGSNWPDNIVCTCAHCNFSKNDLTAGEFIFSGRLK